MLQPKRNPVESGYQVNANVNLEEELYRASPAVLEKIPPQTVSIDVFKHYLVTSFYEIMTSSGTLVLIAFRPGCMMCIMNVAVSLR